MQSDPGPLALTAQPKPGISNEVFTDSQHDVFTVTLNRNYSQSQSTQSIHSQHNVFTGSSKGIRQPVKPASGVSQYYVTMASATCHWQSTSNLANSRQKSEVIVPKIGQACALRKGVFLFSVRHFFVIRDQWEPWLSSFLLFFLFYFILTWHINWWCVKYVSWFLDFYVPSTVLEDELHFQSSFAPVKGTND